MAEKVWKPNVTVAAIVEREGRFLLVEEETAYDFTPEYLVGVYRWRRTGRNVTYLRFAFAGRLGTHHPERALDTGIVRALWLTAAEIRACRDRHRSPLVVRCVEDYQRGARAPLDLLVHLD